MAQDLLMIGELAKLLNVSTHTLRFYEKKGLIIPTQVTEKGYRLYDFNALSTLEEILLLRSFDMPLETIETYLSNKSADSYVAYLANIETAIDERIDLLNATKQVVARNKNLVHEFNTNHSALTIQHLPERQLLHIKHISNPFKMELGEKEFYDILSSKYGQYHIQQSSDIAYVSTDNGTDLYLILHPIDAKSLDASMIFVAPEGPYLCGFHHAKTLRDYLNFIARVEERIETDSLNAGTYMLDIISKNFSVFTDDPYLSYFQLPLLG